MAPFTKLALVVLAMSIAALASASTAHADPGRTTLVSLTPRASSR